MNPTLNHGHRRTDLVGLLIAVVFASSAATLMHANEAPSLAIAFWRNALAAVVLLPMVFKHRPEIRKLSKAQWRPIAAAGLFLGIHFATWVPSVKLTSIASATALVSTQVVFAALFAVLAGRKAPRIQALGIAVALVGVVVLTGIDFSISPTAIAGDLLALIGAVLVAAYMHNGQKVRSLLPLTVFTGLVYLIAAITLLIVCLAMGVPLFGYSLNSWLLIFAVTIFAQFGGHTFYNRALRSFSPTAVSISILFQIPVATIIGWIFVGQAPSVELIPAAILIAIGMIIVIRSERPRGVELEAGLE
ncbi:MAG: DMT family transporter [Micrococcales bacterium]